VADGSGRRGLETRGYLKIPGSPAHILELDQVWEGRKVNQRRPSFMSLKEKIFDYVGTLKEKRKVLSVPEFGEVIYFSPINAPEWERIVKSSGDSIPANNIFAIIFKAEDAEGNKIFSLEDKATLEKVDWRITNRIASEIRDFTILEGAKINSTDKIPSA
jgi:hypothetical protein